VPATRVAMNRLPLNGDRIVTETGTLLSDILFERNRERDGFES